MATKTTKAERQAQQAEAVRVLRIAIAAAYGGTSSGTIDPTRDQPYSIKVVVTKISRDGMHRRMRVFLPAPNRSGGWDVIDVTYQVARALGWTYTDDGVGVGGCGMDMCFHLAYTLGQTIYGEGYALSNR